MRQTHLTLDQAAEAFLRSLAGANKSAATIRNYRTDLTQFLTYLTETNCAITGPADVTRADITEYLGVLADRVLTGVTRARKLAAIREFFRFLVAEGRIATSPTTGVATPKKERTGRTVLRVDEYTRLLSLAGANPRDYAILQVYLLNGLRVSELCSLTLDDIDLINKTLQVRSGKGMTARTIELEKKGTQALKSWLSVRPETTSNRLFLNRDIEPLGERGVQKLLAKYCEAAGISKRISPHSLRHTFASYKAEAGVSPFQL